MFWLFPGSVLDSPGRLDEEHRLIARYAARLAAEAGNAVSEYSSLFTDRAIGKVGGGGFRSLISSSLLIAA